MGQYGAVAAANPGPSRVVRPPGGANTSIHKALRSGAVAILLVLLSLASACGSAKTTFTGQTPDWDNTPFTEGGVASWSSSPQSAAYASDLVADYQHDYGSVGVNTIPIYTAPAKTAPLAVAVDSGCSNFLVNTGGHIPIPAFTALNGSSDDPLVVYQPSSGDDWELWRTAKQTSASYSACWGGELNVKNSTGVFPPPYGLSATGISYLATAITEADVQSGAIDHALALQIPSCNGYVYPADRGDCGTNGGQPPEGQWFRLPSDLPMPSGLPRFAQLVFHALQNFGAVVTDQAGGVMIVAEQPSDWTAEAGTGTDPITKSWDHLPEYKVVAGLPWADLQAVVPPQARSAQGRSAQGRSVSG